MRGPDDTWVADPGLAWQILLSARLRLTGAPGPAQLHERLADLGERLGWPGQAPEIRTADSEATLVRALAGDPDDSYPAAVGLAGDTLVLRAQHASADGLALLALLRDLTNVEVAASARGVADRPTASWLASVAGRLTEVAFAPPAVVAPTRTGPATPGEICVRAAVPGTLRTLDLIRAAATVLPHFTTGGRRRSRRVTVAVGVSRVGGGALQVMDRSGLLRLRRVDPTDPAAVRAALSHAPLQPAPGAGGVPGRPTAWALRILGPRLGSTVLVSHLGDVTCPGCADLAFYPVSGGGSGLSLGAVTHEGVTTLTLRARGSRHDDEGLQGILEALVAEVSG